VSTAVQRDHLLQALARIISDVDNLDQLSPFLEGLGRDRRKFGALAGHYQPAGTSLLATLAHFTGKRWTPELAAEWQAAYGLVAKIMIKAAAADEKVRPPCREAAVLPHEASQPCRTRRAAAADSR
jgi:hemoglobin-like flavoprotein